VERPTLPVLLLCGLLLFGLATFDGGMLVLAIPFLLFLGAGLLFRPPAPRLHAVRELETTRAAQDQPVRVRLTVTNDGEPLEEIHLRDLQPAGLQCSEGASEVVTSLGTGDTIELHYTVQARRGLYSLGGVEVTASDRLGLFRQRALVPGVDQLFVLPDVVKLRRIDIRPRHTRVYSGLIPVRQGGAGIEFHGVRQYQPGDPLRWINARASARHTQSLYVNEFEQERVADVGLILDGRRRTDVRSSKGSLFEHSVTATAALADAFLRGGNRVGLAIYSSAVEWTFPGYGNLQRERILHALARAQIGDRPAFEGLELLPTQLFPGRSQIVLISPLVTEDLDVLVRLRAQGYQLLIFSPNAVAFERTTLPATPEVELAARIAVVEHQHLRRRLLHAGVQVVDWDVTMPLEQVTQQLRRMPLARPMVFAGGTER
jgi:uncharacterized protein (DUF58 family)